MSNEDVWKAWQTAGFESSILSLFCSLSLGVVDWSGLLLSVTVHLVSSREREFVCMWQSQSQCGIGSVQVRLRVEERVNQRISWVLLFGFFPLCFQGQRAIFQSFSFTVHCLVFPPNIYIRAGLWADLHPVKVTSWMKGITEAHLAFGKYNITSTNIPFSFLVNWH